METGQSATLEERGAFSFHPLAAGMYTLVLRYRDYPPVRRSGKVCAPLAVTEHGGTLYPPIYSPPTLPPSSSTTPLSPPSSPPSGSWWEEGGFSSLGDGGDVSARRPKGR